MIETIKAGYDGLKAAVDIAKGISSLKTEAAVNQAVIDIQRHALEAQRALTDAEQMHASDLKRISELEEKIAGFENRQTEKQRYDLKAVDAGLQYQGQTTAQMGGRGMHAKWQRNLRKAESMLNYTRKPSEPYGDDRPAPEPPSSGIVAVRITRT